MVSLSYRTEPMSAMSALNTSSLPAGTDVEAEYNSIEKALLESALGRWFLAEHSRRARRLDSVKLDDALSKFQSSLRQPPALLGQLRTEVEALRADLVAARERVLAKPAQQTAEPAPGAILKSVEALHQMAWSLQASPVDADACRDIARHAGEIFAHSVSQAAQSTRATDVAAALAGATARLDGILQTINLEAVVDADPVAK
jgi:hypothetical protein